MKRALVALAVLATTITTATAVLAEPIVRLAIRPSHISLRPGAAVRFDVYGLDAFENQVPIPDPVVWSTTSGTIEQDGTYLAGSATGRYFNSVKVTAGSLSTTASVTIDAPAAQGGYVWERSWGNNCPGEVVYPINLAIGPSDNVFVVEGYGDNVHLLDPVGNPVASFIPQSTGRIHGTGCAYYGNNVYVSTYEGLLKFDLNGNYTGLWTSAGSAGSLATLIDVATDQSGNIYTADFSSCRVFKLSPSGSLLASWGSMGTGAGQFESISDIEVDHQGNLYVVDSRKGVIHKFSTDGLLLKTWDRDFFAQLNHLYPGNVELDADGNFYMSNSGANRVLKVSQAGAVLKQYICGFGIYPGAVAVDSQGNVYTNSAQNGCVVKFDAAGNQTAMWGGFKMGGMFQPEGVGVSPDLTVFAATGRGMVTRFDTNGRALSSWPAAARTVEVDSKGYVYAVAGGGAIKHTADGTPLVTYTIPSTPEMPAIGYSATVGTNGNVYITDDYNGQVFRFAADGTFISQWGGPEAYGMLKHITSDPAGVLWLVDSGKGNIEKLDLEGKHLSRIVIGDMTYPWSVAVAPDGTLFTAEWSNDRVQKFNQLGGYLGWWGGPGGANGKLYGPSDIAIDSNGCIYIADELNHRICKFTPIGSDLARARGMGDGNFVILTDQVVAAGSAELGGCFFIENKSRTGAFKVVGASSNRNLRVTVMGTLCTVGGERTIKASSVTVQGADLMTPLAMTNKSLGGASTVGYDPATGAGQMGVEDGQGANNVGLLVRTTGKVTAVGEDFFYIDDGTHARDGSVFVGVRVVSRAIKKPVEGANVTVTGISRIHKVGDRYFRCIWPRTASDILVAN